MWCDDESRGKLSDEGVRREIGRDGRRQRKWRRRDFSRRSGLLVSLRGGERTKCPLRGSSRQGGRCR